MTHLTVRNLHIEYPDQRVFDDVDLDVDENEILAIETHVLDGGSSLLKALGGMMTGINGSVLLDDVDLLDDPPSEELFRIGFVYEEMGLLSHYDVYRNICLPLQFHTELNPLEIYERVDSICKLLNIDESLMRLRPYHLNDVQTRMINLARALVVNPKLLLIDELEGGMSDDILRATMLTLRQRQQEAPMAIVITTSSELVLSLADRVLSIADFGLVERVPA